MAKHVGALRLGLGLVVLVGAVRWAEAQETAGAYSVPINKDLEIKLDDRISRAKASRNIVDVSWNEDRLVIIGESIGETSVRVAYAGGTVEALTVRVTFPTEAMSEAIAKALPGSSKNIRVESAGTTIVMSGQVNDVADVERAQVILEGLARASIGEKQEFTVVNGLTVAGDSQVQLEVAFAEVSRSALRQIGLNFWHRSANGNAFTGGVVNPGSSPKGLDADAPFALENTGGLPIISAPVDGAFGLLFAGALDGDFPFAAALSVLSRRGYARTLSEPTLVAMSGEEATFLAGGEVPVPIPQGQFGLGINYKAFGAQLAFTPTVLEDSIQLKLAITVSDLDESSVIKVEGVEVPSFTTRKSTTTVRLRDGQSFAIAGLISDRVRSVVDKIPLLGDIPVLGALFRSVSYRRDETELLVIVTARLVRPLEDRPGLPGQYTTADPSDLELFLLGTAESKSSGSPPAKDSESEGQPEQSALPTGPVGFAR